MQLAQAEQKSKIPNDRERFRLGIFIRVYDKHCIFLYDHDKISYIDRCGIM